jgi:uncharacterized protein (DUF58 family)
MRSFLRSWFLSWRFFAAALSTVALCALGGWVNIVLPFGQAAAVALSALVVMETITLWRRGSGVQAHRTMEPRLSNGDENPIEIIVDHTYGHAINVDVIDELPTQFQVRDLVFRATIRPGDRASLSYLVRPVERGVYTFGAINVLASTRLGLVQRRFACEAGRDVAVHPSYLQMRRIELLAVTSALTRAGVKRIRRIGHTMEFEKIKQYASGDDIRTMNWKATARTGQLMVNLHQDERSQDVYSVLDLGRVMRLPFDGMTLLDYAVNSTLAFSNVVMAKYDRAGLITYGRRPGVAKRADRRPGHLTRLNDALYDIDTDFEESDDAHMVVMLRTVARTRGLVMLYTNMESLSSMRRRLPYFRQVARHHVLVVVLFENTELRVLSDIEPKDTEQLYTRTIARTFAMQKREIVAELRQHGIHTVLTPPQDLSMATVNTYLALKARGVI